MTEETQTAPVGQFDNVAQAYNSNAPVIMTTIPSVITPDVTDDLAEVEVPQEQPEDFGEVAFEAVGHAVETVVEEAETLTSEAVSEVRKVWNIHLQAWV